MIVNVRSCNNYYCFFGAELESSTNSWLIVGIASSTPLHCPSASNPPIHGPKPYVYEEGPTFLTNTSSSYSPDFSKLTLSDLIRTILESFAHNKSERTTAHPRSFHRTSHHELKLQPTNQHNEEIWSQTQGERRLFSLRVSRKLESLCPSARRGPIHKFQQYAPSSLQWWRTWWFSTG